MICVRKSNRCLVTGSPRTWRASKYHVRLSRAEPKHPRSILVNLSGRGDKDMDYVLEHYGTGEGFEA